MSKRFQQRARELFRDYFQNPHHPEEPCLHMKPLLSDLSDGTARGLSRLYAVQHVAGCKGCAHSLEALKEMRKRLRRLRETSEEIPIPDTHWNALEAAWNVIDQKETVK